MSDGMNDNKIGRTIREARRTLHPDHDDIDVLKAQVDYLMEMLVTHWHEMFGVYPGFTLADFMGIGDFHYAKWVETGTLKFVPMMDEKAGS